MRVSSTALRHVRELEILVVVEFLSIVPVLCCLTHHMLELHRLNEICVPFQVFTSTFPTLHSLMMSCSSTLSSFELVLVCVLSSVEFLPHLAHRISFVFTLNVVSSFLLPLIKARLRVESCFNCAARSSDFFNREFTSAFQSVASFNKYSMLFLAHSSRNQNPRLYALALSLELVRTRSFQLFLKFCQGVFKLLALLVKISKFVEHWFHTRQLVCS